MSTNVMSNFSLYLWCPEQFLEENIDIKDNLDELYFRIILEFCKYLSNEICGVLFLFSAYKYK